MKRVLGLGLAMLLASPASAGIISVSGDGIIDNTVTAVLDNNLQQNTMIGFDEQQNVVLGSNIAHDTGIIAAGTAVNSHFIFLNRSSGSQDFTSTYKFNGKILGVMSDGPGTFEAASTGQLGALDVLYPTTGSRGADPGALGGNPLQTYLGFSARGLESNDSYSVSGNVLEINMLVSEPGDWIRVVTAVPEPTSVVLWGLGAAAFAFTRGRRKLA